MTLVSIKKDIFHLPKLIFKTKIFKIYSAEFTDEQQMHGHVMEAEKRMVTYIKRYNKVQVSVRVASK